MLTKVSSSWSMTSRGAMTKPWDWRSPLRSTPWLTLTKIKQAIPSAVAPSRLFNAFFVYGDNVLPKIVPQWIKGVELIKGDGGVGSIKKTNFGESSNIKYAKYRIDTVNMARFICKYTMIESDIMVNEIDRIEKLVQFVAAGGGCACKMIIEYHVEEHFDLPLDDIDGDRGRAVGLFRAVEEYLLNNPNFLR